MIAIIDYGMEDAHHIGQVLEQMNCSCLVTADRKQIEKASGLILAGAGAFGQAMYELEARDLRAVIQQEALHGKPLLGIGLGMQLLFTSSDEQGYHQGLHLLPGHAIRCRGTDPISHMQWKWIHFHYPHKLFHGLKEGEVYFLHSYYVQTVNEEDVIATTDDSHPIPAIVARNNMIGLQFHPEKSEKLGLQLLKRFTQLVEEKVEEVSCEF
jgi:imidazole glycerol-phosphate synthase subunit HisH